MDDCIFCKIISKQIPAEVLYENEHVLAILDIHPIHFGHSLVISKTHCKDFLELPEESYRSVLHAAKLIAKAFVATQQVDGYNLFSNNGRIAGQSVFHFHMHVTPRFCDDNIRFVLNLKNYPDGELHRYGELIRAHIHSSAEQEN